MKGWGWMLIGFLLGLLLWSVVAHYYGPKGPDSEPEVKVDTLFIRDTIRIPKPFPVATKTTDTIRISVPVLERDTIFVSLPREEKEYKGEDYRAIVSGYEPALDLIEVYPLTTIVNKEVTISPKPKRWGIGVNAGYGIGKNGLTPYVGVGISYDLLQW